MSKKNPEYDFKWCPGCGDFGVKRALEWGVEKRNIELELPMANTVVVAGIGCSGNLVHLLDGAQPFGIHGLHGRTLPVSFGIKMAQPDLNVVIVSGDGDFLSIGAEHIAPQAQRNLNVTAIVMDNAVYGLTKGQSSPTSELGMITPTTPFGKLESALNPLELYMTLGVSFVASGFSSKPRELANMINEGMKHPGFAMIHVQSPCTTYFDTTDILKGNARKGIAPTAWDIPENHDATDRQAAYDLIRQEGIPLGILYQREESESLDQRVVALAQKAAPRTLQQQLAAFDI
ncbi:2-oxoacid:ferredoxin oxidoreductase subunit beta [SAR202 cluster bacterium AC-647-N09_OGT_505m]|nr:2-oxoacid:ferredoxin oxidoreductase subunit beta [SAR202 cluster bacterium AC-647-N09_OGT_505m]